MTQFNKLYCQVTTLFSFLVVRKDSQPAPLLHRTPITFCRNGDGLASSLFFNFSREHNVYRFATPRGQATRATTTVLSQSRIGQSPDHARLLLLLLLLLQLLLLAPLLPISLLGGVE